MTQMLAPLSIPGRLHRLWRSDSSLRGKVYVALLGIAGILAYAGMHAAQYAYRQPVRFTMERLPVLSGPLTEPMAGQSITPITNVSGGASGIVFSGDAYDVNCTTTADTGTLYPALHDGSGWTVYQAYPCNIDGNIDTKVGCIFPARRAVGSETLTWNAFKTGSASLSNCTAQQRYNGAPFPTAPANTSSISASAITSGTLAVARGGTGLGSYTAGDLLYASGATTLSKLGVGSDGNVLTMFSGGPAWRPASTTVRKEIYFASAPAAISNTQTNAATYAPVSGYTTNNVVALTVVALRAGSITGLTFSGTAAVTAGSITPKCFKNGTVIASCELAVTSGQQARTTFSAGTYTFAAGDTLSIKWTTTADYAGPDTAGFSMEITE